MPFDYDGVYKTQRVYMLRFETFNLPKPKLYFPEIDPRGFYRSSAVGIERGPVLGTTAGDTVFIILRRVRIGNEAPLFVTSSDEKIMIAFPTRNPVQQMPKTIPFALENSETQPLAIKGIKGGAGVNPNVARVEIRYGSKTGPIVAEMTVYVFSVINVWVVPQLVKIGGVSPTIDVNELFKSVQAIWQPCGIRFVVKAPFSFDVGSNVLMPGKWADAILDDSLKKRLEGVFKNHYKLSTELNLEGLSDRYYSSGGINIYFVNELVNLKAILEAIGAGKDPKSVDISTPTIAFAFSPEAARKSKTNKIPQIVCSSNHDQKTIGFALAHEIGHYLELPHIDDPFGQRKDPPLDWWSLSSLMRTAYEPKLVMPHQGHLISMKDLKDKNEPSVNHISDPEWATARQGAKVVQV